jgi:hypothetical protein
MHKEFYGSTGIAVVVILARGGSISERKLSALIWMEPHLHGDDKN